MAELRDLDGDLEAGQLAAFARLGALGHLDLDLAAVGEILGGDAKAPRSDLLDRRIGIVAVGPRLEARRELAPFAGIRLGADPVHGDVERAMRLRPERTQ